MNFHFNLHTDQPSRSSFMPLYFFTSLPLYFFTSLPPYLSTSLPPDCITPTGFWFVFTSGLKIFHPYGVFKDFYPGSVCALHLRYVPSSIHHPPSSFQLSTSLLPYLSTSLPLYFFSSSPLYFFTS
ncbi:MAG: hypothetical protein OEX02_14315 [Cyclobacteriaceae bacterium]|nr:hypothetical protein [Cyclobacteriaceae bacterium]